MYPLEDLQMTILDIYSDLNILIIHDLFLIVLIHHIDLKVNDKAYLCTYIVSKGEGENFEFIFTWGILVL